MSDKENKEQEYLHEALDRAHIASSHLQMALETHQVIENNEDVKKAYEEAVNKIEDLYQLIGNKIK